MLIISFVLAIIPLLGIAWVLSQGLALTVDNLFMSLILLAISGIFALNAFLEVRKHKPGSADLQRRATSARAGQGALTADRARVEQGKVESVLFFESNIGQPNKSIVTLSDGGTASRMLVFEGDVRNALPVGKKVEITAREDAGRKTLLNVNYR
jgi:hypothetical protein